MKNLRRLTMILSAILPLLHLYPGLAAPKIDPIKFSLTTNAKQISIGEEFELTIKAQYLSLPSNAVFVFDGSNSFRIKLLFPEGFEQTGGTYRHFVNGELNTSRPSETYTVKGKFTTTSQDRSFRLLRGHKNANEESKFIQVATLSYLINEISNSEKEEIQIVEETEQSAARILADSLTTIPYMTIAELRSGMAGNREVVYITDNYRSGIFRYRAGVNSGDDSSMVLISSGRRYLREFEFIRPEYFGATGDGVTDDTRAINQAINYGRKGDVVFKANTYIISSPIILQRGVRLLGEGVQDTAPGRGTKIKLKNNANCSMIQTPLASGTGAAGHYMAIENILFDGNGDQQSQASVGIDFRGAYITSYLKNIFITSNRGPALSLQNGLDVELHHIWINNTLLEDDSRYALEINRGLAVGDDQDGLVHMTHIYIENTRNKEAANPRYVPADRGNGMLIRKTATFYMSDVHFEGLKTCITLSDNHTVNIGKISTAHCGVENSTDNAMIRIPDSNRSVTIESTESYSTSYNFIMKKVGGFANNEIPDIPYYSYSHGVRFNDNIIRAPYILPRTSVSNTLTIAKVGTTSPQQIRINNDLAGASSGFIRSNGRYFDFGSNFNNPADRTVLRLDVPNTGKAKASFFSKVSMIHPLVMGSAIGPMDEVQSVAVVSGISGLGSGPAFQRKLSGVAGLNYFTTVRSTYNNPDSSASYLGEFLFNRATKKYWVSISVGNGANDWQLMSHGPTITNYGTFLKQIRINNDSLGTSGGYVRITGRYLDLGSNYGNGGADKTGLRLDFPGSGKTAATFFGKVNFQESVVLGDVTGPMDAAKGLSVVSGISGLGKGPAYQRKVGSAAGVNFITTVRWSYADPDSSATYLGEFHFNRTTKKYWVSVAIGNGASDWELMNHGPTAATYRTSEHLNYPSINPGQSSDLSISLSGAAPKDFVTLGLPAVPQGYVYTAWVSALNVVTIRLTNNTAAAINPPDDVFRVLVTK